MTRQETPQAGGEPAGDLGGAQPSAVQVPDEAALASVRARAANLPMMGKLVVLAALMFGFGWAMIPIYNAICEATGIRVLTKRDGDAAEIVRNTQVDRSRTVRIELDSNGQGPWTFRPKVRHIEVHPGELTTVDYELINNRDQAVSGQAIPSYAPSHSAGYFHKVECFCFEQQVLQPRETRIFPVVFMIDPKLPADVGQITLSYTFFDVGQQAGVLPAAPVVR